jgi:hypothetical protein
MLKIVGEQAKLNLWFFPWFQLFKFQKEELSLFLIALLLHYFVHRT